ncbi:MAG: amidophosphoribosyltransferase [Thermoguttaceae bacterium]|nr:amidophosphoribosyltransferase [Thermoguttaceae bacterium]MDW8039015.1 amidophosphoribosyltransferase [Thermoguttaceae bacterium]
MHEACGIAAIYYLPTGGCSRISVPEGPEEISRLLPRMLLDVQNRGQLSAGFTTYNPHRRQLLETYKDVGTVSEVFRMTHKGKFESLMKKYAGRAAIGHVRYATCGQDDRSYAQPFERRHIKKHKWFSFAFNGQVANFSELREELLSDHDCYLAHETDTEILMHLFCNALHLPQAPSLIQMLRWVAERVDGAYSLVFLDALGQMLVARDPLGFKPLTYAVDGPLFAAASESVALLNLGFRPEQIQSLLPGHAIVIRESRMEILPFTDSWRRAHCFFEWIYFSNVASTIDGRSVYLARKALGEELARLEDVPIDEHTVVVPVPDTSKAAADAMAYRLGIPCVEGLIRNRYTGRTFIEGPDRRTVKAQLKYIPLREVLEGKRVLLVEDSIVRATTMKALLERMRELGRPREIHVRVGCPPIISPCFYGIDMSTLSELFAPQFLQGKPLTPEIQAKMAQALGADSLRYLPIEAVARAIGLPAEHLCQACITGQYPTAWGARLAELAAENARKGLQLRTYEVASCQK